MGFFKDLSFLNMILSKNTGDFISNALIYDYMAEDERISKLKESKKEVCKKIDKLDVGFFTRQAAKSETEKLLKAKNEKDVKKVLKEVEKIVGKEIK